MKNAKIYSFLFLMSISLMLHAQEYSDYLGAGHSEGVNIMTSSNSMNTNQKNSFNGVGLNVDEYAAARFLNYASLGADYATIKQVAQQGIPDWLGQQLARPPLVNFTDKTCRNTGTTYF